MMEPIWVNDKKLANYFDVSRATIWRWVKTGKLPQPVRITPGCSRWRLSEVKERMSSEGVA